MPIQCQNGGIVTPAFGKHPALRAEIRPKHHVVA
jgi:hypothetical protein